MAKEEAPKAGIKSSEFWISAIMIGGAVLTALADKIDGNWAIVCAALATAAYTISRGMAKIGSK